MKELQEFQNCHQNQDIYIIASGPSLDFIEPSFFDNKITIGINQIYKKINTKYLVRKETALLQEVLNNTKEQIHFISYGNCGGDNNRNFKIINNNFKDNNNIVVFKHNKNIYQINKTIFNNIPENGLIVSMSTITTGIHLAAYMGAKNIILVGHDCGVLDNKCNTSNYHTNKTYNIAHKNGESDYRIWLTKIDNQTLVLKNILKEKYNCNIYSLNPFINFGLEGHKYSK